MWVFLTNMSHENCSKVKDSLSESTSSLKFLRTIVIVYQIITNWNFFTMFDSWIEQRNYVHVYEIWIA
jgi:hypothetical protein